MTVNLSYGGTAGQAAGQVQLPTDVNQTLQQYFSAHPDQYLMDNGHLWQLLLTYCIISMVIGLCSGYLYGRRRPKL